MILSITVMAVRISNMLPDFNKQIENLQDEIHMLKIDRDYWQEQAKTAGEYISSLERYVEPREYEYGEDQ